MTLTDKPFSRREFARRAALGAASAVVLPLPELLPTADAPRPAAPAPPPAQTPSTAPKLSAQSQAEAGSRYQAILNQYGDRFSDAQKTDLKRLCVFVQPPLDRIRAYAISNGDLPALYLKPFVDRDKKSIAESSATRSSTPTQTKSTIRAKP
jgi:hypothetical protein